MQNTYSHFQNIANYLTDCIILMQDFTHEEGAELI